MQKVEGSSPFIRFTEPLLTRGFCRKRSAAVRLLQPELQP